MKVSPCLAALEDLKSQKEQLERERGNQFTENDILEFVADLLQGDPADKDYQKKLIDNLVVKVFVSDGYMTAHIKLGNATEVADIRLEEVKKALEHLFTSVQTLSPLAQRKGFEADQDAEKWSYLSATIRKNKHFSPFLGHSKNSSPSLPPTSEALLPISPLHFFFRSFENIRRNG